MIHVVLLGDSIFDNGAYVGGLPDVVQQLRGVLPAGSQATLAAADGAVLADIERQLPRIPVSATHLVLSIGDNDALGHGAILERSATSVAEVLDLLAELRRDFDSEFRQVLRRLLGRDLPLVVCTIYEGALPDPAMQPRAETALTIFNDVILRAAFELQVQVVDLRLVCRTPSDYANPIEPSVQGGASIALAINRALTEPCSGGHSAVFS